MTVRLRTLALLQGLLVAAVPLTVLVLQVPGAHQERLAELEEDAFIDAREAAGVQQRAVRDLTNALSVLVEIPPVARGEEPNCSEALDSAAGTRRDLEAIWRIDDQGSVLCSSRALAADLSDWQAWHEFRADADKRVGFTAPDPVTGELVLPLAARVPGQPAEMLIGALRLARLHERMQTLVANDAQVFLVDPSGVTAVTDGAEMDPETLDRLPAEGGRHIIRGPEGRLYVSVPLDPEAAGSGQIVVGIPTDALEAEARQDLVEALVIVLVVFAVAVVVAWGFALATFGRPVRRLAAWVRRLEHGLDEPAPATWLPQELQDLADALASMAQSIDKMDKDRRRLLNHVAHQLRTPLTPLRMQAKVAEISLARGNVEQASRAVGMMDRPLQELAAKADKLDVLGGLLLGSTQAAPEATPPKTILEAAAAHAAAEAAASQTQIVLDLEAQERDAAAEVYADPRLAAYGLNEILENALNAARGSTVRLFARRQQDGVLLAVEDEGKGLSPETMASLQRGQWAWDGSDARSGLGAGLLIARLVAQAHSGRLHVSRGAAGAVVGLWFPDAARRQDLHSQGRP